ncbi:hypothetical protein EVG20_g1852 [Dentipellis fragilis]|uniref:DNA 3'-5' helicase n=1 Tax=Dentipellis fragilis TaxID=205917 RepID=A0A4Y9ZCL6_9AGAM|nr:hypothetical protein EVG20_g1852 [Dentipellis fragilis]
MIYATTIAVASPRASAVSSTTTTPCFKMDQLLTTLNDPQRRGEYTLLLSCVPPAHALGISQLFNTHHMSRCRYWRVQEVLTSRIAYLIIQHRIAPSSICAVTFTNKAANEMRVRLTKLIGKEATSRLRMGTFHSLCARFLRMHANLAGLESNFTICDAQESQKIIAKLLKPFKNFLEDRNISLKESSVAWRISQAKSKGQGPDDVVAEAVKEKGANGTIQKTPENLKDTDPTTYVIVEVFREYRITLLRSNSLDFDDLLLYGVKLFGAHKKVSTWCKHILVDEFQDTNTMQYELMTHIAAEHQCVTIVGDPDQSIYAWRSADVTNLTNMIRDFPATEQIFLEQNYRSTASILSLSLAIISEDKERIKKSLHTAHPKGPAPTQLCLVDEIKEAEFIATEIKRLVAVSGGMLTWSDFAILMRFTALSREIETALQRESIPHKVLGGHKFFERMEVKDILAYLQIVDNGSFLPAFNRCINNPPRSIGEKSVSQILQRAEKDKISALELVERIYDGKAPDIKPPLKRKVATFVSTIRTVRNLAKKRVSAAALIRTLLDLLNYEEHLKKTQDDWQNRWENVQELINFASKEHETGDLPASQEPQAGKENDPVASQLEEDGFAIVDNSAKKKKEAAEPPTNQTGETPLRLFLQASMLSTDTETKDKEGEEEKNKDVRIILSPHLAPDMTSLILQKVILSTCHSAKGLEWPVVIVPATENGVFPHIRSEDEAEERRLLYVACTRAQSLLYLLTTVERMVGGARKARDLSFFVTRAIKGKRDLITAMLPEATLENRKIMAGVLSRPLPPEAEVEKRLEEFDRQGVRQRHLDSMKFYGAPLIPDDPPPANPIPWGGAKKADPNKPFSTALTVSSRLLRDEPLISQSANESRTPPPRTPAVVPPRRQRTPPMLPSPPSAKASSSKVRLNPGPPSQAKAPLDDHVINLDSSPPPVRPTPRPGPSRSTLPKPKPSSSRSTGVAAPLRQTFLPTQAQQQALSTPPIRPTFTASSIPTPELTPKPTSSRGSPSQHQQQSKSRPTAIPRAPSIAQASSKMVVEPEAPPVAGTKRRLGMGRPGMGYSNKKFKSPGQ